MDVFGNHRCRRIGTHAAGIGTSIAVQGRFVVLGRRQGHDNLTVGEGQKRRLLPFQKFLDNHATASGAKSSFAEDVLHRGDGFRLSLGDDDTLTGSKAVGLDHDGRALLTDKVLGLLGIGEGAVSCGRHSVLGHQVLGETLAALDLSGFFIGAEDGQTDLAKAIDKAQGQGKLRSDHGQTDLLLLGESQQPVDIIDLEIDTLGQLGNAGIAWGTKNLFHQRGLGNFPDQGVLTPAAANYQNVHIDYPFLSLATAIAGGRLSV